MNALARILAWTLAVALIALPVVAVVQGWIGAERWPLRTLRINDNLQQVDPARVREVVLPYAQQGFFAVRLDEARESVARLPWVEQADVGKRWPDVLEVRVQEHRPFARWGDDRLLSLQGKLFPAEGIDMPQGLPLLHGPDARAEDVVELYHAARELFAPAGYGVRALLLDSRGSWTMVLSNGTRVAIGSHQVRTRLARFARLLPQLLTQRHQPLERADLRYTNGFALTWAEEHTA
ncbi:cell division protein FtsQ/DivIB [Luteimonas sp. MJ250]|uniref:cell division protein FtsQ/DivIB n=1 Tax=Luteimonas sp. MJ250 TaxID=3129236 RepID=UPI0031BB6844